LHHAERDFQKIFVKEGPLPPVNYKYEKRQKELEKKKKKAEKNRQKEIKKNIKPEEKIIPGPEK
jgi:major membrane immunogen (membrane-anchored lipoprotein)